MGKKKNINYDNWSKDELIKEIKRIKETIYGLVWHRDVPEEKIDVFINPDARTPEEMFANEVAGKPFPVLKEVKGKEVESDEKDQTHLMIEGDNYHALAVLNFTHQEAIDVIYIDPPYNRGEKDFIYNDNYNSPYVKADDPFKHSKWLSFMERRLRLAKNVLKSEGVIFISIDNNEQAPLKMLCDEIFGEDNFVGCLIWRKKEGGGQTDAYFVTEHEYILAYAKSSKFIWLNEEIPTDESVFNKSDDDGKFKAVKLAKWGNASRRDDRPKMYFPIKTPDDKNYYPIAPDGGEGRWRVGKKRMDMLIEKNLIYWKEVDNSWIPYEKIYYSGEDVKVIKERSIIFDLATTADGTNELTDIFGKKDVFQNPKPTELIQFLIEHSASDNAVILDFFAGSGTTGHAVLKMNTEDNGKRRFILCTNNDENIAEKICFPRLGKVMKGYNSKKDKNIRLGGNLKYFTAYDFVESEPTDKNKRKLVKKSTEMLCIKEGVYNLVKETEEFKIFKNSQGKHLGIIFYEDAIDEYKKEIKKLKEKIITYVFSLGDDPHHAEFEDVADKVDLQPIPEVILRVYREIFK